jgi:hypothetical protein
VQDNDATRIEHNSILINEIVASTQGDKRLETTDSYILRPSKEVEHTKIVNETPANHEIYESKVVEVTAQLI